MRIRPMAPGDLEEARALFESMHWPYTQGDLERLYALQPDGWFCAEHDGAYLGQAMGLLLGGEQGAVGLVGVPEARRNHGLGTKLTQAALDFLLARGATQVRLDATDMGAGIYERMGFTPVGEVYHFSKDLPGSEDSTRGESSSAPTPSLAELVEFDARTYGAGREQVLAALARDSEVAGRFEDGELRGYCMTRPTAEPRGGWIGPLTAGDETTGRELLEQAIASLSGRVARLGVPAANQAACRLLEEAGFSCDFALTRMYYGDLTARESLEAVWAEAGHEKG
jgi:ribosomal protein S18 acetylase RimI-like enzyme